MGLETAESGEALVASLKAEGVSAVVGFFGDFSAASRNAQPEFEKFCALHAGQRAVLVDVGKMRDVHGRFGVTEVPTVIAVHRGAVLRKVVGPQTAEGYERALQGGSDVRGFGGGTDKPAHRVIVYTTDTCPWCTRVKGYLRTHHVGFQEINVSRDESAARTMVQRSGQQGVPQLDIDGRFVVGFDKGRIDELLGIKAAAES